MVVEKILRSMTARFGYVVCAIDESNGVTTMSVEELHSKLLVHERRMNGQNEEEQALKVSNNVRFGGKGRGRGLGKDRGRQPSSKEHIECYKSHKL